MYAVSGATGRLGRVVIDILLGSVPASQIVALARSPDKARDLAAKGVEVREADYDRPETLRPALEAADRLLLIAGNEVGRRVSQHQAVIDAAVAAGVGRVAYTSLLHADSSPLAIADEHLRTERALAASGLSFTLLRNGWYTENYFLSLPTTVERGILAGSAGDGRISAAPRADYAAAAAAVLLSRAGETNRIYELAGDDAFTMADLAAEISRQAGKPVAYRDLPEAEYRTVLSDGGLPENVAAMIARSSSDTREGALFDDGHQMSRLIGRPTTPLKQAVAAALSA
jgi:NAD(P)H dehydrogenase (quinone)